ncbi:MAG TPA: glycosyltransferase family 2 protein, partial [Candidatus Manganitrophaceae bacterium]|nr:glycosyltransferase family 2 protein [Candidatus Manganitrophaceae bacterium]
MSAADRPRLSVTVITLNEESEIGACLASVAWADEIVVVDSGSADRTVEIAKKYTERVLYHEWPGYAAQKNWALGQASHDWVLSLDADERVAPDLQAEIREALTAPARAGYYIGRKNFFLGRWIR